MHHRHSRTMKNASVSLVLVILIVAKAASSSTPARPLLDQESQPVAADLESFIPDLMTRGHVPGLSVAVIRDGGIVWHGAFGVKNAETGEAVDEETIFEAASLTKPLFAYLVLQLVAEGILDLDKPMAAYLPQDLIEEYLTHPLDHPEFRRDWFEKITARQVLSHSSGMPHGEPLDPCLPLLFEPGKQYKYSATGYFFLQVVVEHLMGTPVEDIAQQYVFAPLGMDHSSLVWRNEYEQIAANGHGFMAGPEPLRKYSDAHAAASMYTTAIDYARFICAVLNAEQLSSEDVTHMLSPQIEVDEHISWSLGFGLQRDENGDAFWQWGDYGIFRNFVIAYRRERTGIVFLTNSWYGLSIGRELIAHGIGGAAHALDWLEYQDHSDPFMHFAWIAIEGGADPAIPRISEFRSQNPELLDEAEINALGYGFLQAGRLDDAITFFELNAKEHPESANVWDSLGEGLMASSQYEAAITSYQHSLKLDDSNENARKHIDWMQLEISSRDDPLVMSDDDLESYVGTYGPRKVTLRDGVLHYLREGTGNPERTLRPLTRNVFALNGSPDWRFHFVLNDSGRVVAIEGLTINGVADRHERE